jgi:hypothetical protein
VWQQQKKGGLNAASLLDWPLFTIPPVLPFTGPIAPTDEVIMLVQSKQAYRWRVSV